MGVFQHNDFRFMICNFICMIIKKSNLIFQFIEWGQQKYFTRNYDDLERSSWRFLNYLLEQVDQLQILLIETSVEELFVEYAW